MKNINAYIVALFLVGFQAYESKAQDYATALKTQAVYNHYYLNLFLINPAYTGFDPDGKLLLNYRSQWAGFESAPKGITLAIDANPASNMGLGGMIYNENYGVANRFQAQLNYAYHFKTNQDMRMALGLSGAYIQYGLDNEAITDPLHQNPDTKINEALNGEKYFAADFGFYAEVQNKYKFGISIPHIVQTRLDNTNTNSTQPKVDKPVNFTGFLGIIWPLPEYRVVIEPSIGLRKISDVPFGADFNLLAKIMDDKLFAGFTYSYNPSWHRFSMLAGIKLDRLGIFYSYDQSYLEFQNFNNGSHEITISFGLNKMTAKPPAETDKSKGESMEKKM
jgi:type IX secretion system PorP/SprF family membrane protein